MNIYLDMDGTIADLYGVDGWLGYLLKEDEKPYKDAKILVKESVLLNLIKKGYELNIITWLSKDSSKSYDKKVRKAKKEWLKSNYPNIEFKEIHIIKYGTSKYKVAKDRNGILVDDELKNRKEWKGIAIEPQEIYRI